MTAGHDPDAGAVRRARASGAEIYLRLLVEAELRRAVAYPRYEPPRTGSAPRPVPAAESMDRVRAAAEALTVIGAIEDATAHSALTGFKAALALRSKVPLQLLDGVPLARWNQRRLPAAGLPGGAVHVVSVGGSLPGGRDGEALHLLTLLLAPGRAAALTVAGRVPPDHRLSRRELPIGPFGPYSLRDLGLTFTDDRGNRYGGEISGGGTCDGTWWSLELIFSPLPPADIGWLDIAAVNRPASVRVHLAAAVAAGCPPARPVTPASAVQASSGTGALPPVSAGSPGERLLDSIAENLLWSSLWHGDENPERPRLAAMAAALRGAHAVKSGSPALNRYAALSHRLGIAACGGLRAATGADLPPAWDDVLAGRGTQDGREEAMPVAAVLPEIDGARFALTGLCCSGETATLRALAWGWQPEDEPLNQAPFSWWARDSAGRWHVARQVWSGQHRNGAVLDITLIPPLHPAATSLEIFLTGSSERATATVPLLRQATS
jgi:hypothetical protein